jgi:hypothetical protein
MSTTNYHCILCGRTTDAFAVRPGAPIRCALHLWKNLGPWEAFTEKEARREGEKRVSSLSSLREIAHEGQIAYAELVGWEQELANPAVFGSLRQYALDVIAAKKAYLSAFD